LAIVPIPLHDGSDVRADIIHSDERATGAILADRQEWQPFISSNALKELCHLHPIMKRLCSFLRCNKSLPNLPKSHETVFKHRITAFTILH